LVSDVPVRDGSDASPLRYDGAFLRRIAQLGASRGPSWWLRYSPPLFGLAAAALLPAARRAVQKNLTLTRGRASALRDLVDTGRTFATYAGCFAEGLATGAPSLVFPTATVHGELHLLRALAAGRGVVVTTAHTAGWDNVGPLLGREHALHVMMAMHEERDPAAARVQDGARAARGLRVVHVGADPLASLDLLNHVRSGGAAALQVDRVAPGQRTREVRLFDVAGLIPEGPLRLAQVTGAPVLPVFCARVGFRRYVIEIAPPIDLPRRATEGELDHAAQSVADAMTRFLRAHPTQWLRFRE
jgi:phosphatidylinositol dimannoside acyltransferase